MGQEAPFRWPVRLRCRRIRDFSDSFSEHLGEYSRGQRAWGDQRGAQVTPKTLRSPKETVWS
jgi:hypothetical protein